MPTIDQVRVLTSKGVPYVLATQTDAVASPNAVTSSASTAANPTASAQPVASDLATAIALVNELRTQMGVVVTQNAEIKQKYNQAQTDIANLRAQANTLNNALRKNSTIL